MFLILDTETNGRTSHGVWTNQQHIIRLAYNIVDKQSFNILKKRDYIISDVATKIYNRENSNNRINTSNNENSTNNSNNTSNSVPYTMDDISNGYEYEPIFRELLDDILKLPPNSKIIAHNISFDATVLVYSAKCKQIDNKLIEQFATNIQGKGWCSMKGTINLCKLLPKKLNHYKYPKLTELYKHLYMMKSTKYCQKNTINTINEQQTTQNNNKETQTSTQQSTINKEQTTQNNNYKNNTTNLLQLEQNAPNNVKILTECMKKLGEMYINVRRLQTKCS